MPTMLRTPGERKDSLVGLAFAPLIAAEVLRTTPEFVDRQVDFLLYDGVAPPLDGQGATPLFSSMGGQPFVRPLAERTLVVDRAVVVGGRELTLRIASTRDLEAGSTGAIPLAVAAGGALLSLLLAMVTWLLMVGRQRALDLARSMTADLARMAKVVQRTSNAVFGTDLERRITWVNEGFTRITGYTAQEAIGRRPSELLGSVRPIRARPGRCRTPTRHGQGEAVEILNRRKDGTAFWALTESQPSLDLEGRLTGFLEIALDITHRKAAEDRLKANQALLDQAERIAELGAWVFDLRSGAFTASAELQRMFGVANTAAAPAIESFLTRFDPHSREVIASAAREAIREGKAWDLELPVFLDGRQAWIRSVGQVEREGERSLRLLGAVQDITQRHALRDAMRLQNEGLQAMADNLPCGLAVFDSDRRLVIHNQLLRELLDLPQDLMSRPDVTVEDLRRFNAARGEYEAPGAAAAAARLLQLRETGQTLRYERTRPNGTHLEVLGATMPGGGFITVLVDATDRKRTQTALAANEQLMRVVTDNIPARVAYWNRDLTLRFANRHFFEHFGVERTQAYGRDGGRPDGRGRARPRWSNGWLPVLAGQPLVFERVENGRTQQVHYVPDLDGASVPGFFVLVLDVTELRDARDAAVRAAQAKSDFLATMSHEMRTPLNGILSLLRLLMQESLQGSTRALRGPRPCERAIAARPDQRLARPVQDRGRPAGDRTHRRGPAGPAGRDRHPVQPSGVGEGAGVRPGGGAERAAARAHRRPALAPGAAQPAGQCGQVHRARPDRSARARPGRRHQPRGRVPGARHRDRDRRGDTRSTLCPLHAGRWFHRPALRRNGPRARHLARPGAVHGRRDRGAQRPRPGLGVRVAIADAARARGGHRRAVEHGPCARGCGTRRDGARRRGQRDQPVRGP